MKRKQDGGGGLLAYHRGASLRPADGGAAEAIALVNALAEELATHPRNLCTPAAEWRAILVCFHDRYGSQLHVLNNRQTIDVFGDMTGSAAQPPPPDDLQRRVRHACVLAKKWNEALRGWLARRTDRTLASWR